MLVSTRGRYALRIILELSTHDQDEYVPLIELSQKQDISLKYAEAIVAFLTKAKLLEGKRGKSGGYKLVKKPSEYTVGEILKLTEESLAPVSCLNDNPNKCPKAKDCKTLRMWENMNTLIQNYLFSVTIDDLNNPQNKGDWNI
ncbi:MAG: Rrf2 family transcriptional regulator [Treponema sp.]|nr:Rrf2 family transcriptional regulator [Treponema sp.]MBR4385431.1 Rrf2 family transcriptional regulator [Treponema sp.]